MSLPTPYYQSDKATLYCGDCLEILPHLSGVDAVVTDPPYPKQYDHVWDALGDPCFMSCGEDAFLVTLCGQFQVPRVIRAATSGGWQWYWCGVVPNTNCPIMHGYRVKVCQKPVLVFRKGAARPQRIWLDNFAIAANVAGRKISTPQQAKSFHVWGQASGWFYEPCAAFAESSGTVCDPFMGSGTTGVDAMLAGRKFIGIELEPKYCEIAKRRIIEAEQSFALFDQPKPARQLELQEAAR